MATRAKPDPDLNAHDPRMELISLAYRLHGALRSDFAGPPSGSRLVLLEALVLGIIDTAREAPTVAHVGRQLGYSRQSVQRAANKLLELGYVERNEDPRRKGSHVFCATEEGSRQMQWHRQSVLKLARSLAGQFDDARCRRLAADLRELVAEIQQHTAGKDQG